VGFVLAYSCGLIAEELVAVEQLRLQKARDSAAIARPSAALVLAALA
jgi:hypothetical protein